MEKKKIPEQTQKALGVPRGAEGWYFALANAISASIQGEDKNSFLVIAWDKPPKQQTQQPPPKSTTKAYGVFKDHATFWENLNALPADQRYAYEVLPTLKPCRGYWDIEFCIDLPTTTTATNDQLLLEEATRDTNLLMKRWIAKLKETVLSQLGIIAKVAVLDGTRIVSSPPTSVKVKFSFHVILVNVSFLSNQSRAFHQIKAALPTLYNLAMEVGTASTDATPPLRWKPPQDTTGAPDMCVYSNNQLFRCLSCAKRGVSTPLTFASADLTDTTNPYDAFVSIIKKRGGSGSFSSQGGEDMSSDDSDEIIFVPEPPKTTKKTIDSIESESRKKRKKTSLPPPSTNKKAKQMHRDDDDDDNDDSQQTKVENMLSQYPHQMKNIHSELQELLRGWGDLNTKVEKLVRVTNNLRYQCRNVNSRSCILSSEAHQSNTPIMWLDSSRCTNEGELADHYQVIYNCKSSECQGQGVIGQIELDKESGLYKHRLITPPINSNDPKGLVLRARLNKQVQQAQTPPQPLSPNQNESESMQTFIQMLQNNNDGDGGGGGDDGNPKSPKKCKTTTTTNMNGDDETMADIESQQQEQPFQTRDLVTEKLIGYGWSQYELQTFGRHKTYEAVKREQEKTLCKILTPNVMYIKFKDEKNLLYDHYTYESMQKYLKSLFYYKKVDADSPPDLVRFFNAWTDDPNSRTYDAVVCDPSKDRRDTGPKDLNVWPGFSASTIPDIADVDAVQDLVRPIVSHICDIITSGVKDHAEWLLDWMANIVQRPEQKTQVPVVISGKQGVGKGIIFDFFREFVLGFAVTTQVQNASQDLFSRFANKHVNKVLLQLDEGDGLSKYADHLKNLTTSSHINYEIKGLSPMVVKNYLNIIITTNHERPVLVETSDRRFVLFKASDIYLGNPPYYRALGSHLKRPQVARAFYQFLMARDLTKYVDHFQTSRPVTDYYLQARKNSISNLHKFISALINSKKYAKTEDTSVPDYVPPTAIIVNVHPKIVFQEFIRFLDSGRYQSTMTATGFASKIKLIEGVNRSSRRDGTPFYSLNYTVMRHALQKSHEYDDEITLD
jgi:hypothetical protein